MASRCQHCAAFSIEHALEAYSYFCPYPHHETMSDLCKSATSGCDMCQLMVVSLKKERLPYEDRHYGRSDLYSYLLRRESQNDDTHFNLCLDTRDGFEISLLNELHLRSGFVDLIKFRLATSRRMPWHHLVTT